VALVLHAHLPWVRHPEHARSLEERWLYEAIWESYLPLLGLLDRLGREGVASALTISVSPPLAAMLADDLLRSRFDDHLARLSRLASSLARGSSSSLDARAREVMRFYEGRLAEARAGWDRIGGDVLGALRTHEAAGRVELWTSTATHAYLPGLLSAPASVRAQLRLGRRGFAAIGGGAPPRGLWLPECAYDPLLGSDLAAAGVRYTILDAHGVELAQPRPPAGVCAPVIGPGNVAYFARDPGAARDVWSRREGYPGDPHYREFYRDVGFDLPEAELAGEIGPGGTRLMTGLKPCRITGPGPHKEPYDPLAARGRAREHARHFVDKRRAMAAAAVERWQVAAPILVAPFDAELFGHWWFEGPEFLEDVLRELDASERAGGIGASTLGGYLDRHPQAAVAEPAASSWGEGGFGQVWAGPEAARLWRHVHHAERAVRAAVAARRHAPAVEGPAGVSGRAVDQAIRELLLLEASDWAFMMRRGEMTPYAEARVRAHVHRALRLAEIALAEWVSPDEAAWVDAIRAHDRFLAELSGEGIRDAFDPWG
jgi:1,4-alpha-glucan branching enzyme